MAECFAKRVPIVTGGVLGIDAGIAARPAAEGAHINLWDLDAAALAKADVPHKATVDVTDAEAVQCAAPDSVAALGRTTF
jgi:NAD(P)-dependent dehydrogenase (short-subunit alcohol dehydrogenase family)